MAHIVFLWFNADMVYCGNSRVLLSTTKRKNSKQYAYYIYLGSMQIFFLVGSSSFFTCVGTTRGQGIIRVVVVLGPEY